MHDKLKPDAESLTELELLNRRISKLQSEIIDLKTHINGLKAGGSRFRQFAELLPEVVYETNAEGQITFFNDNALKVTGYTQADIGRGLNAIKLFAVEDQPRVREKMKLILGGQESRGNTYTAIAKSGERANVLVYSSAILEEGKAVGVRGIAVNITDKLKLQKELEKQRDFVNSILETANTLIVCLDSQANIIIFNQQCEVITGYKREEVLGKHWPTLFVPEENHMPPEVSFADWARQHPKDSYERPIKTKSGQLKSIIWSNSTIFEEDSDNFIAIAIGHDISDIKLAEKERQASEEKYRLLVESVQADISVIDYEGRFLFANEIAAKTHNRTVNDMLGLTLWDVFPKHNVDFQIKTVRRVIDTGKECSDEVEVIINNSPQWYRAIIQPYADCNKNIAAALVIGHNITSSKLTEKAWQETGAMYRSLLEQSNDAIYHLINGRLEFVNSRFVQLFGWSEEELLSPAFDIMNIVAPKSRPLIEKRFEMYGKGEPLPPRYEFAALTKSGHEIELEVSTSYIELDGKLVVQGIYHDITERKKTEAALRESRELYQTIWSNSPVGISLSDIGGVYHYVNPAYCKIYGYEEEELIGKNFFDLIVTPELRQNPPDNYRRSFEKGAPLPLGEAEFVKKNGDRVWVQYSSDFIRKDGQPLFLVTMNIDITDKRTAEDELKNSKLRFEAQYRASPVPLYTWRKIGDDFELIDFNNAAFKITNGKIKDLLGIKITNLYSDQPELIEDIRQCFAAKGTIRKEIKYRYKSTSEEKYLNVSCTYAPPDIVLVHTDDITQSRLNEFKNYARLKLLTGLRVAPSVNECLRLGCEALANAMLFKRAVLTLHNESREIINLGQIGLDKKTIAQARRAPAPDAEIAAKMLQEKYRIHNSYFIPVEAGLPLQEQPRYIAQTEKAAEGDIAWHLGDELFVPIIDRYEKIIGWLSVDTPINGNRPSLETISFMEEMVDIVIKKVQSIQSLKQLEKERQVLEDKNIALRELFEIIEEEKLRLRKQVSDSVEMILQPAAEKLINCDGSVNSLYYQSLKNSLRELGASAGKDLKIYLSLSAREAEICRMIKGGASSKDIATAFNVTLGTVQKHREKIRKKLGISNKNVNLSNYLKNT